VIKNIVSSYDTYLVDDNNVDVHTSLFCFESPIDDPDDISKDESLSEYVEIGSLKNTQKDLVPKL